MLSHHTHTCSICSIHMYMYMYNTALLGSTFKANRRRFIQAAAQAGTLDKPKHPTSKNYYIANVIAEILRDET